jgi:hypothetical protein
MIDETCMRICKKCNDQMDIKNSNITRRGNKQKNLPTEYYCSKCDHFEYNE